MRTLNKKSYLLYILLSLVAVLMINIVARNLFFRLDLTDNKMYSLSNSSKSVLDKIDDLFTIKVYFSENLPGEYGNNRRYLQDILEEYSAFADGNLQFEFYMPDDDEKLATDAQKYGIQPVQLQVIENDKMEVKRVYMGMVLLYADKREVIPIIQTTTGLEYEITTKIKKLVDTERNRVVLAAAESQSVGTENLMTSLRESYDVQPVQLANPIAADVNMVLMNGVSDSLTAIEYANLRDYLARGGTMILAQARIAADLRTQRGQEIRSNIFNLIDEFGLHLQKNLVLDRACGNVTVSQNRGFMSFNTAMEYPFFPLIRKFENQPIVAGLEQVRLFFSSEIKADSGATVTPLFLTSERSGLMAGNFNLSPIENPQLRNLNSPAKLVAAYAEADLNGSSTPGKLILISDSDFMNDNGGGRSPENMIFVMNAVDFLVGDAGLVSLRSREITTRPLEELEDSARARWKWLNILLPALLVIGVGIINWKREAGVTKHLEELYD